jgi:hypothetical protein
MNAIYFYFEIVATDERHSIIDREVDWRKADFFLFMSLSEEYGRIKLVKKWHRIQTMKHTETYTCFP